MNNNMLKCEIIIFTIVYIVICMENTSFLTHQTNIEMYDISLTGLQGFSKH